jgi:hypothetical protein
MIMTWSLLRHLGEHRDELELRSSMTGRLLIAVLLFHPRAAVEDHEDRTPREMVR